MYYNMKKIAIITIYYGEFHNYFDLWKKSVEYNTTIDFLLFTENDVHNCPPNLIVYKMSFENLKALFQKNFDFPIALNSPYKICDFRPAFGEIFSSYIKDYDFWGYTDFDVIFGNLRKFISDDMLSSYLKIFGRGHLSLMHNDQWNNELYKKCKEPNYRSVYSYSINVAFDEYYGFSRYYDKTQPERFYQKLISDDINCMKYRFSSHMKKKEDKDKKNIIYRFDKGRLYKIFEKNGTIMEEECICVHFQKRKMNLKTLVTDSYIMIPNYFIPQEENLSLERLRQLGHRLNIYPYKYKLLWNRIVAKLKKIRCKDYSKIYGKPQLPNDGYKYYKEV